MFHDTATNLAGFETPKGDSINSIYLASLWMSSADSIAPEVYKNSYGYMPLTNKFAMKTGPVDIINQTIDTSSKFQRLWKVEKDTVDYHIANWNQPNYQIPTSILEWPGNGNSNTAKVLAPFEDIDGDSIYEPHLGDYPIIKGDQAIYLISNSFSKQPVDRFYSVVRDPNSPFTIIDTIAAGIQTLMQLEIHTMVYAFTNQVAEIENTVFVNTKIFHRSTDPALNHKDFRLSLYNDFDIGNQNDDFIGTDTNRNMTYVYNSSNFDDGNSLVKGYGKDVGIQALKLLDTKFSGSIRYAKDNSSQGWSHQDYHLLQYQNNRWTNRRPIYYGGNGFNTCLDTSRTSALYFPGDPALVNDPNQWTELNFCPADTSFKNTPSDQVVLSTANVAKTFTIGTSIELNYAYVFAQDTSGVVGSITALQVAADSVQDFYDRKQYVGISEGKVQQQLDFTIYPNPANEMISIETDLRIFEVEIINLKGQLIQQFQNTKTLDISTLTRGIYFVKIQSESKLGVMRLIVVD